MEVLVGARDDDDARRLKSFLAGFHRVLIDELVSEIAVEIRRRTRIRLPDALIWASARRIDGMLVTRNTKDFPGHDPAVRVPYSLLGVAHPQCPDAVGRRGGAPPEALLRATL